MRRRESHFYVQEKGSSRDRHTASETIEFMMYFIQNMPPSGFMKVRYYGFMNPDSATGMNEVRTLIELCYGFEIRTPESVQSIRVMQFIFF
ncbi:MAG: transposase [Desulfococcaceae bacterium]|nr:transposase [Desulfococcaceae bacterium]